MSLRSFSEIALTANPRFFRDLDEAVHGQLRQRLAQGVDADAIGLTQAFDSELAAGAKIAAQDVAADPVEGDVDHGLSALRFATSSPSREVFMSASMLFPVREIAFRFPGPTDSTPLLNASVNPRHKHSTPLVTISLHSNKNSLKNRYFFVLANIDLTWDKRKNHTCRDRAVLPPKSAPHFRPERQAFPAPAND